LDPRYANDTCEADHAGHRTALRSAMTALPYFFPRFAAFFLAGAFLVDFDFCELAMVLFSSEFQLN
jgi:hypothetical protein